jgi:DNA-binding PadR family transcriptional regulator
MNNGDLTAAWRTMRVKGWASKATLYKALRELDATGFIIKTRQGGRRLCSLYAVTWRGIDECAGKLDSHIRASAVPLNTWKNSLAHMLYLVSPTVVPMRRRK